MFARAAQFTLPDGRHFVGVMAVLAGLDATRSVTEIPIRARDDDGSHPSQGVVREDAAG
ncbi:MAG: hypothetical protein WA731_18930 [Pseudonocardiaceae bacterium]